MLKEYTTPAEHSRSLSWDVQLVGTAAQLVITKAIMTAFPAKLALSQDQRKQPASPPALRAALALTRQQDPFPAPPRAELASTLMGQELARHAPPARPLLLLERQKVPARRVQQAPFPHRHGRHLLA